MSQESRKKWTRSYLIARLDIADEALRQAINVGENGGCMPKALRKRVITECQRIIATNKALRDWAVSTDDRLRKENINDR